MKEVKKKHVVIIGGGFSGIGCALSLVKEGIFDITIIESSDRLGGLAYSFEHAGKHIHTGYHQILETDLPLRELIEELGLTHKISWKKCTNKIWHEDQIYDLTKPRDFLRYPLSLIDKCRFALFMARCYTKKNWKDLEDVGAEKWISSIAGKHVLKQLFAPLFEVKFGLPAKQVSAAWVGSRLGAKEASCKFGYIDGKEWTKEICDAAKKQLIQKGVRIMFSKKVISINPERKRIKSVTLDDATVIEADTVVSTVSPIILQKMINLNDKNLSSIQYIDSISGIVSVKKTKQDFYWLVCMQPRLFIGGLFNLTNLNPHLGSNKEIILNFFTNVTHNSSLLQKSDEEIVAIYKKEYKRIYGEDLIVSWYKINKIPFVSAKYVKGYKNPSHKTKIAGLYLCGNYMSYPSVTSTGTALKTGIDVARIIVRDFEKARI